DARSGGRAGEILAAVRGADEQLPVRAQFRRTPWILRTAQFHRVLRDAVRENRRRCRLPVPRPRRERRVLQSFPAPGTRAEFPQRERRGVFPAAGRGLWPRPPRRPRRRPAGRRAAAGRFRLDCSSGTNSPVRMAASPVNAMANWFYFFTNSARTAVWLCRKFFSPTGPISPPQKKPARPARSKCSLTSAASWLVRPKRFLPRPLQQNKQPP